MLRGLIFNYENRRFGKIAVHRLDTCLAYFLVESQEAWIRKMGMFLGGPRDRFSFLAWNRLQFIGWMAYKPRVLFGT